MEAIVRITNIFQVTHDVKCFRTHKPEGLTFQPGQATEVSINKPGMKNERRPFTFTCLVNEPYLEFMIKRYPERHGVTDAMHRLVPGDELILHDVFGEILFTRPGVFIAGGAGITPFIAILRDLESKGLLQGNTLIFGNKKAEDIILKEELGKKLGDNFVNVLSSENIPGYYHGIIDRAFLSGFTGDPEKQYYVCGPPPMMDSVVKALKDLGVSESHITIEAF